MTHILKQQKKKVFQNITMYGTRFETPIKLFITPIKYSLSLHKKNYRVSLNIVNRKNIVIPKFDTIREKDINIRIKYYYGKILKHIVYL